MSRKIQEKVEDLGRVVRDLPGLIVLGILFSLAAFAISSSILAILQWLFHTTFTEHFVSLLLDKSGDPVLERLNAIFNDPCGRVLTTMSAAFGAASTTHVATEKRSKEQMKAWFDDYNWCDESYDLGAFLAEISHAMKVGSATASDGTVSAQVNVTRAQELLNAWAKHKERFASLVTDYHGDFARLKTLLAGDKVPNCAVHEDANGLMEKEIAAILDRVAKTSNSRRNELIRGMEELLRGIKIVDENARATRRTKPKRL